MTASDAAGVVVGVVAIGVVVVDPLDPVATVVVVAGVVLVPVLATDPPSSPQPARSSSAPAQAQSVRRVGGRMRILTGPRLWASISVEVRARRPVAGGVALVAF